MGIGALCMVLLAHQVSPNRCLGEGGIRTFDGARAKIVGSNYKGHCFGSRSCSRRRRHVSAASNCQPRLAVVAQLRSKEKLSSSALECIDPGFNLALEDSLSSRIQCLKFSGT